MRTPSTGRKKSKAGLVSRARVFSLGTDDDDYGTVPLVCATCYNNVSIVSSSSSSSIDDGFFDERFVCCLRVLPSSVLMLLFLIVKVVVVVVVVFSFLRVWQR